jgi:hypothetical protein
MQPLTSETVLGRTRAGQVVVLDNEGLSPSQAHLLMRLNGYSSLADLICEAEQADMLPAAAHLVDAGLACRCESDDDHAPITSQWGDLLSVGAAGG